MSKAYGSTRAVRPHSVACPSRALGGCGAKAGLLCFKADGLSVKRSACSARVDAAIYAKATTARLIELLSEEKALAKLALVRAELARRIDGAKDDFLRWVNAAPLFNLKMSTADLDGWRLGVVCFELERRGP